MILNIVHVICIFNSFGGFFWGINLFGELELSNPGVILFYVIVNLISGISLLGTYIYLKRCLDSIKKINKSYDNISLYSFQTNMKTSIVMNVFGLIGYLISFCFMLVVLIQPTLLDLFNEFVTYVLFLLIGSLMGTILEISAWGKFEEFINNNKSIFPPSIRQDLRIGSGHLKYAAAFSLFELGIDVFMPFIGLGAILGFYYYIVGFNTLGRSFCLLEESDMELSEPPLEKSQKEVLPGEIGTTMEKIVKKLVNLDEKIDLVNSKIDLLIDKKDENPS